MKNKFIKASYNLMAAFVLTILVAGPHAAHASGELLEAADTELEQLHGGCISDVCVY